MSAIISTIIVIVVLIGVGFMVYLRLQRLQAADKADGVIAKLMTASGPLRLTETELIEGYGVTAKRHPVAGLTATVEDSGTVNRRITATRAVLLGPLAIAAPKKLDDRESYLVITGPSTGIVRTVSMRNNPTAGQRTREFAIKVSQASSRDA